MHTEVYTYFTEPNGQSELLYSAESWVRAEFQLETAGPVAVSTRQDVAPLLSGKGVLLPADGEPIRFVLPKGDRIFIVAEAINRVKFIIEPIPWLEQILRQMESGFGRLVGTFGKSGPKGPTGDGSSGKTTGGQQDEPCPTFPLPGLTIPRFRGRR